VKIPDFISPISAWRVWQWDAGGLKSLNGERWVPGKPLRAGCKASESATLVGRARAAHLSHDVPEFNCTCGIYGSKSLDHLRKTQFWQYGSVHGEVRLWGKVVQHENGCRAEFAYPQTLYLSSDTMPVTLRETLARIRALQDYGCNLFIAQKSLLIPLWRTEAGFDAAGMDFLLSRGQEWYARQKQERTLSKGDRIAVLGRGVAVVKRLDHENIYAVLWNRSERRIQRKEIIWDENNMRWEATQSRASHASRDCYR
jgi:hypothetical protein